MVAQVLTAVVGTVTYPIDTVRRKLMMMVRGYCVDVIGYVSEVVPSPRGWMGVSYTRERFTASERFSRKRVSSKVLINVVIAPKLSVIWSILHVGFFPGWTANLLRSFGGGLLLVFYDDLKKLLKL